MEPWLYATLGLWYVWEIVVSMWEDSEIVANSFDVFYASDLAAQDIKVFFVEKYLSFFVFNVDPVLLSMSHLWLKRF